MTSRAAAVRYARALFDVARKENLDVERIERELAEFNDLVTSNQALNRVLSTPAIPASRKRAAVEQLLMLATLTKPLAQLLLLLADRDRLVLLPELSQAFRERVMDFQQVVRAQVTTAVALPPDKVSALQQGIARATGRKVHLETTVDPALIGGAVTRIGSTVYDGSVTTQLQRLKERLTEADA
jgi:F-type H+-transporting ATPase subunit delta